MLIVRSLMTGSAHRGQCFSLLLCGEHSWRNVSFPLGTIGEERRSIWVRVDPFGKLLLRLFEHNGESSGIGDVPVPLKFCPNLNGLLSPQISSDVPVKGVDKVSLVETSL